MSEKKDNEPINETYEVNGNDWKPVIINIKLSGRGNYVLAKMRLLNPNITKTKLAKEILEKALIDLDVKITEI